MSNYKVISNEAISNVEAFDLIKKKIKEVEEPTYREEKLNDFLKHVTKLKSTDFKKAVKELKELELARLEDEHIIKIVEIMPKNGTELRAILSNSGTVIVDEDVNKVTDVLKKYA